MLRYITLAAIPLIAACEPMPVDISERVLPAEVRSYLLPGQPESIVVQNREGCYLISNELSESRTGYFLRDRQTNEPLCYDGDGMRIPYVAPAPVAAAPDAPAT